MTLARKVVVRRERQTESTYILVIGVTVCADGCNVMMRERCPCRMNVGLGEAPRPLESSAGGKAVGMSAEGLLR